MRLAIVTAPFRLTAVGFGAMVRVTTPLPLPLAPDATATHDTAGVAVQPHPPGPVTVIVAGPPVAVTVSAADETVNVLQSVGPAGVDLQPAPNTAHAAKPTRM